MAARSATAVAAVDGVELVHPTEANGVFAVLPSGGRQVARALPLLRLGPRGNQVRWMCCFDTTEADVDAFVAALKEEMAAL